MYLINSGRVSNSRAALTLHKQQCAQYLMSRNAVKVGRKLVFQTVWFKPGTLGLTL